MNVIHRLWIAFMDILLSQEKEGVETLSWGTDSNKMRYVSDKNLWISPVWRDHSIGVCIKSFFFFF